MFFVFVLFFKSDRYSTNDFVENVKLPILEQESSRNGGGGNGSKLSLTGDNVVDADITAFINARKKILNQMKR